MNKNRLILNIYQLPGKTLVDKKDVTGQNLDKTMKFARDQLSQHNRLCVLEKRQTEIDRPLHMYARRAGKMRFAKTAWCYWLMRRMWAFNNKFSKCLGGE